MKLTKRGEIVVSFIAVFSFLVVMGFVGWLENLAM